MHDKINEDWDWTQQRKNTTLQREKPFTFVSTSGPGGLNTRNSHPSTVPPMTGQVNARVAPRSSWGPRPGMSVFSSKSSPITLPGRETHTAHFLVFFANSGRIHSKISFCNSEPNFLQPSRVAQPKFRTRWLNKGATTVRSPSTSSFSTRSVSTKFLTSTPNAAAIRARQADSSVFNFGERTA